MGRVCGIGSESDMPWRSSLTTHACQRESVAKAQKMSRAAVERSTVRHGLASISPPATGGTPPTHR